MTISSFEALKTASGSSMNTASISAARAELTKASMVINSIEQNIKDAAVAQEKLNNNMKNGSNHAGLLNGEISKVGNALGDVAGKFAIGGIIAGAVMNIADEIADLPGELTKLSDEYSGILSRIKLITSGEQAAAAMNDQIYYSALRARGSYAGMADAVSKIGLTAKEAFPDPNAIVPFVENIQKLFTVGGTGIQQQKDAMLQLTQALGSGKLQGDEFRSIAEAAPMIEQIVAHFMGVTQGQLKQLSSDGKITADIIKNAILGATDEINEKFAAMPMTWGQVWQNMQTVAFRAFVPVFNQLSAIANSDSMKQFGESTGRWLILAGQAVAGLINNVQWLTGIVSANGAVLTPIFMGLAIALLGIGINSGFAATMAIAHGAASMYETGAIIALTFAQDGLNAAIAMCPLTWIIFAIIALVGIFYLAVAAVNHFAGTSLSATGIVVGAFFWLGGMIYNVIAFAWNILVSFAESLGNLFRNPTAATYNFFATIWNGIVELVGRSINEIIGLINKLPGMEMGFINWGKGLAKKMTIQGGVDLSAYNMDYSSGNFMKGYNIGAGGIGELLPNMPGVPGMPGATPTDSPAAAETAKNTGKIKDKMDIVEEDLKYLRDVAEQEVINRFTTAEIKIDMTNHNTVNNEMDLDGIVNHLETKLDESMRMAAEGVHI